jgi:hypothetical protein
MIDKQSEELLQENNFYYIFFIYHINEEASRLLNVQHLIRRLKLTKPLELVKQFDN